MVGPIGDVSGLVEKVDRLEEELRILTLRADESARRHRRGLRAAGLGAFVAAVLLCGGGAALVQQFNQVNVVGPNNDVRVSMKVDPITGSAGLEILGVNGRRVIFLGTSQEGLPNLAIFDATGQRIVREIAP
jgi:hypothetical protein